MSEELPEPEVSAAEYDTSYYLHNCGGHEEWVESEGRSGSAMYPGALKRANLRDGEVVVDIGTGRGELLAVAVQNGASRAIGIEYSADAVALAEKTIETQGVADKTEVLLADARAIPLEDGMADLVTMLDVVEHLSPAELDASLRESYRLLRPGGRILIHTFPTSTIFKVYKLQRRLVPGRASRWPADPRHPLEIVMHINEQTAPRLRRSLKAAGFDATATLGEWVFADYVPESEPKARRLYARFAKLKPTRRFGVANLWGEGRKPQ
jgi:ubiquinone/menaquinone biosynthesis C-methylase UbiE